MSSSEFHEKFKSKDLRDFRLETVASSDHETPLTGYETNRDMNLVDTEELDLAATSDIYWQHTLDDNTSRNDPDVDDNQLAMYLAGVIDSTGKPVAQRSSKGQFSWDTRNLKSAQSQFPVVSRPEMICQLGGSVQTRVAEEREIAQAQIRTMLDEQRRILIAECSEKVLRHELLAAHAEQDRKILHEELRQQQEFREVHQQDLMKHLELQKFQNSESQKTIMDLSGRLQELQNEVNLMNDSKDFMDAESTCSGNLHVTSPPGLFPKHPPFEGLLKPAFISQRQDEEPPNIWDTSGISGNVFANPQASSSAPYSQELNSSKWNPWRETTEEPIHKSIAEKSGRPKLDSDLRCQSGPSARNSVLFNGGDSSKNYGADQQRLQISDLHFDKFPTPATFLCWKIRFKTEVCTCSQFPTEAMPSGTSYGYQDPEKHVLDNRAGQPVETSRSNYSQKDYGRSWSSQEWKSGDGEHDRSEQPDRNSWDSLKKVDPHRGEHLLGRTAHSARNEETIHDRTEKPASEDTQDKANFEELIMGSDTTEFVNKVRNQVRIRQKRMSSIAENCTEHSIIWRMFMATTLNAATFMGKNYSTMQTVVKNEESLTLKQMFDVTAQIVNNEEEISCLDKILYGKNSWTQV